MLTVRSHAHLLAQHRNMLLYNIYLIFFKNESCVRLLQEQRNQFNKIHNCTRDVESDFFEKFRVYAA